MVFKPPPLSIKPKIINKKIQGRTKRDTALSLRKRCKVDLMLHEIGHPWLMILNKCVSLTK